MRATSFGTGELILHAIEKGAKHILLGIGGSATNDCGMGMAAALGYSFLDANGQKLKPIGANLTQVETIDVSNVQEKLKNIKFSIENKDFKFIISVFNKFTKFLIFEKKIFIGLESFFVLIFSAATCNC